MIKLRNKSKKYFERLDVDSYTTCAGILGVSHDDQEDPLPVTLVDVLKNSMKEQFEANHVGELDVNVPLWKAMQRVTVGGVDEQGADGDFADMATFQRKILPFDAINLAAAEHLERSQSNAAGTRKHELVLCASLIDKPPNLGGLARTCEIFAMKKLVIPDLKIKKMDNFKATSVSAEQWVDIEECKEQVSWEGGVGWGGRGGGGGGSS
jgi:hypothetical protein